LLPRAQPTRLALLPKQKLLKPHNHSALRMTKKPGGNARLFSCLLVLGIRRIPVMGRTFASIGCVRLYRLAAGTGVILLGLALRRFGYDLGLTFPLVKYGGSVLWGSMVYLLTGTITATRKTRRLLVASMAIAAAVEFSRLYHTPALDAFRLTLAGQLLLGRVFSVWNILAYGAGILTVWALETALTVWINRAYAPAP
jgi:hypothetical protein